MHTPVLLDELPRWASDDLAVIDGDEQVTFAELRQRVDALAAGLQERFPPGSRAACVGDNCIGWVVAYYGVPRAGMTLVLLNHRLDDAELQRQITESGAVATLDPHDLSLFFVRSAVRQTQDLTKNDEVAWLLFTSGTTGRPKPVGLTHRNLVAGARTMAEGRPIAADEVFLMPFPLCHIAGINVPAHHAAGRPVVLLPRFRADEAIDAIRRHGVTGASLAPTMLRALLDADPDVPTLRRIGYGAAPMPAALRHETLDRLPGVELSEGYGMTEAAGNVAFDGRPSRHVEVRIADDGEILLRGEQIVGDGWLHTGDVGRLDDDGHLYVVDRKKDIVVTGGENVSSREVEDALSTHPAVTAVAVIGVPDDYWGEAVCAVVVAGDAVTEADLVAHAHDHLAGFKCPKRVVFVDELPLNATGKVVKAELRRQVTGTSR